MPWLELIGVGISVLAGLIAIRGNTWNAEAKSWHRKVTVTGWASLVVVLLGGSVSSYAAWREHWLDRTAVRPVLSKFDLLYDFTARYRVLREIAESDDQGRAGRARELIELPEMKHQYDQHCREYIQSWERWRGETDPRVRNDLQMIVFMCRREKSLPDEITQDALKLARYSVCRIYSQSRLCEAKSDKKIEQRLNATYLVPQKEVND